LSAWLVNRHDEFSDCEQNTALSAAFSAIF